MLGGGLAVEHGALPPGRLVVGVAERLTQADAELGERRLVGAEDAVPGVVARTAPSSTAASRARPRRSSSAATERSIVHWVDHTPARRQWAMRRR